MAQELENNIGGFDPEIATRLSAAGHEIIPGRRTYRHRDYRHRLNADQGIFVEEDVPMRDYNGEPVKVGMLLPERIDLACDEKGIIVSQAEFERRWLEFIENTMLYGDPGSEPIPDVLKFIRMVPDRFSEGPGVIEVGYDARKPAEDDSVQVKESDASVEKDEMLVQVLQGLVEKQNEPKRGPGRPPKVKED